MYISKLLFVVHLIISVKLSTVPQARDKRHYEGLGLLRLTEEWKYPWFRPVTVIPSDRRHINTIFLRWILQDKIALPEVIGTSEIESMGNKPNLKLLIHDFTSNGYTGWIQNLARHLLSNPEGGNLTIVSVNWAAGAEPPYIQAVANARSVALEICQFLSIMQGGNKRQLRNIHVIGHGVGAHIAGYVGKTSELHRITALDPSGLYYTDMPADVRLDKEDAYYVEVIHTDTTGQGTEQLLGHADFFPNGGKKQPGCKDLRIKLATVKRSDLKLGEILPGCSHKRSLKYYIEAISNPSCSFVGVVCSSFKDFLKGKCTTCGPYKENCMRIHPVETRHINTTSGLYFVTSKSAPFCAETLKVVVGLKSKSSDQLYVKGYFNATISQAAVGDVSFLLNENGCKPLRTNDMHKFLVIRATPPPLMLPAIEIHLQWLHSPLPSAWCDPPDISCFKLEKFSDSLHDVVPNYIRGSTLKGIVILSSRSQCFAPSPEKFVRGTSIRITLDDKIRKQQLKNNNTLFVKCICD